MSSSSSNKSLNPFNKEEEPKISFWKWDQNQVKVVKKKISFDEKRFSPKELYRRMENAAKEVDSYLLGPGAGAGIGCGAGVGIGLVGGAGFSFWPWNEARVVFGFGAGCGVGAGFGYGFGYGKGLDWETLVYGKKRKSKVKVVY